ncbi:MAG: family 16 glycosylhydrolase [Candidatus Sigynarchaeota archaeon]
MVHITTKIENILAAFLLAGGACTALVATGAIPSVSLKPGPLRDQGRWGIIFEDNFDGTSLNLSRWSYNYPVDWPHGGHTHNHEAYMAEENVLVEGGLLRIVGEDRRHPSAPPPEETGWGYLSYNYTAGAIHTMGKFSAKYGYFEARMKFPEGPTGFWPAFWTLNEAGGWPPEIDIHEWLSNKPRTLYCTFHYRDEANAHRSSGDSIDLLPDMSKGFHVYGVEWSADSIAWYFDNAKVYSYSNPATIAQLQAQYIIINLAVGGWAAPPDASTAWPAYYEVDWVRVWQPA